MPGVCERKSASVCLCVCLSVWEREHVHGSGKEEGAVSHKTQRLALGFHSHLSEHAFHSIFIRPAGSWSCRPQTGLCVARLGPQWSATGKPKTDFLPPLWSSRHNNINNNVLLLTCIWHHSLVRACSHTRTQTQTFTHEQLYACIAISIQTKVISDTHAHTQGNSNVSVWLVRTVPGRSKG